MRILGILIVLGGSFVSGCKSEQPGTNGGKDDKQRRHNLQSFAIGYHNFAANMSIGPADLDEMLARPGMAKSIARELQEQIRNGSFIVIWSAVLEGIPITEHPSYLGFEKDTPTNGGWVIRMGGEPVYMSAEEFSKLIPVHSVNKPEVNKDDKGWTRYYCVDNRLSLTFPEKPERRFIRLSNFPFQEGQPIVIGAGAHEIEFAAKNKAKFNLRLFPLPPKAMGDANAFFEDMRMRQLAVREEDGSQYQLLSEKPISFDGLPVVGKEFRYSDGQTEFINVRFLVHDSWVYCVSVTGSGATSENPDVKRFMESVRFHLTK